MHTVTPPLWDTLHPETPEKRGVAPVRRNSRLKGREGVFWRPMKRQEVAQIVLAARKYERQTRQPGRESGALGYIAIEILDLFANLMHKKTGRLDPSIDWMMKALGRSRDAIVRALKALRQHGFLDWLRRFEPTGNECGPQVKQASNAYRLFLPNRARALLGRFFTPAPVPDDFGHRLQLLAAEIDAHKATLALDERALFEAGDTPLGQALARLARGVMAKKERESVARSELESR